MDMNKSDRTILKKMQEYQKMLAGAIKEFNISSSNDLTSLHYMVRRGIIQTVGDIFELTVPLNDEVLKQLPINISFIKRFRHTASHSYGLISNEIAYACITHCTEKKFVLKVEELLEAEKIQEQAKPTEQDESTS
jgi:hypothetical protein